MIATEAQAKEFLRKPKTPVTKDGKRVKRRIKKRKEKRSFYCEHCKAWHLTSKKHYKNKKIKDR